MTIENFIMPVASWILGAAVTFGALRQKLKGMDEKQAFLESRLSKAEIKLDLQVGESRCDALRAACLADRNRSADQVAAVSDKVNAAIEKNRELVLERFAKLDTFIGQQSALVMLMKNKFDSDGE